jgi:hypothetical protein
MTICSVSSMTYCVLLCFALLICRLSSLCGCLHLLIELLDDMMNFCISGEHYQHDDSDPARESYGLQCAEQLFYSATDVTE